MIVIGVQQDTKWILEFVQLELLMDAFSIQVTMEDVITRQMDIIYLVKLQLYVQVQIQIA